MSEFAQRLAEQLVIAKAELIVCVEQQRIAHADLLARYPILRDWTPNQR